MCASRTSGVAPLGIFFDATGITASGVTKPFHHLQYTWDFGDGANNSQWANGASGSALAVKTCDATHNVPGCKNYATGAIAAHVYETAGTYTASLTVSDGLGNSTSQNLTITVSAASTLGAPYCIYTRSALGNGICSGNEHLSTGTFQGDIAAAINAGSKYILFKRGDYKETQTGTINLKTTGPGLIGSYGSGSLPVVSVAISSYPTYSTGLNITGSDWRVMDMEIDGASGHTSQTGVQLPVNGLALRLTEGNFSKAINDSALAFVQEITVNPSTDDNAAAKNSNYGQYCNACSQVAWLGDSITLGDLSSVGANHGIRLNPGTKIIISNTTFHGSPKSSNIVIHGGSAPITQYVQVEDNLTIGALNDINPQNSSSNHTEKDVIFERNFFSGAGLYVEGQDNTIRNNVFDFTAAPGSANRAINVSTEGNTAGAPSPSGLEIYNNSFYAGDSTVLTAINFYSNLTSACNAIVANNIAYYPNGSPSFMVNKMTGQACVVTGASGTNGNSTNAQTTSTSPYAWAGTYTITLPSDFALGSSSYAITPGTTNGNETGGQTSTTVPLWTDFFETARQTPPTAYDAGAVKY